MTAIMQYKGKTEKCFLSEIMSASLFAATCAKTDFALFVDPY